ncbi:hypothetical protein SAY86_021218 [Trapa natans]|uniref:BTB domain-containing protein n=1 Tax=Trapa natans TaxID=22666 RepID=A0AAN7RJV1_TRANT|nr:hypothetical protein SAY86_021218 [Trapa natans]
MVTRHSLVVPTRVFAITHFIFSPIRHSYAHTDCDCLISLPHQNANGDRIIIPMEPQFLNTRSYGPQMKMTIPPQPPPSQHSDNDRTSSELRALDCNLSSLCDHIQVEGFNSGAFSDIDVHAMGSTYHLHRLILSRSSYFRNMLHGPWKEANAHILTLNIDDKNVSPEAIATALAYLYGHHPKLNDSNAFRVLAAASFLDLQDLCAICTDFIISELWTSNFLGYQVFAESQDYGIHGERVRNACWGYLCQSGAMELKEVLPKLSSQTLHTLLTSDELWVPCEEKRFELALFTLLSKGDVSRKELSEQESSVPEVEIPISCGSDNGKGKNTITVSLRNHLEPDLGKLSLTVDTACHDSGNNLLVDLGGNVADFQTGTYVSNRQIPPPATNSQPSSDPMYSVAEGSLSLKNFTDMESSRAAGTYVGTPICLRTNGALSNGSGSAMEGPSDDSSFYRWDNNTWLSREQSIHCSATINSCYGLIPNDWGRCGVPSLSWGGRVVGRRQVKDCATENCGISGEEYDTFVDIFEGGSLLYCNMSFEALINVRNQLEELGFPCKAVNDSLWLQMLLSQRVQEIAAETCKNCCLLSMACACRQPFGFAHGLSTTSYYMQDQDQNTIPGNIGHAYMSGYTQQGEHNGSFRPVRGPIPVDGLAGIGRGTTFVPAAAWPPTRYVFSRVPFGVGTRNCQQPLANDDSEARAEQSGDLSGDGLTALVGLSQGGNNIANGHSDHNIRGYEMERQSRFSGTSAIATSSSGVPVQVLEHSDQAAGMEWKNGHSSSISLDMKTPLSHFPPFRFGVEFEDVHRLNDGQVKHSPEVFYAGSLWKVSIQAFNDEDPQGRRTLGLFLHRRKAEIESLKKVHMYVDTREKVTARYQLICPSKREVMVFGSFKQRGTLLPKAPKGWGWRTALLFDELPDLLQSGALRVAAVVQLV